MLYSSVLPRALALMVAVPAAMAVTVPELLTVATLLFDDDQTRFVSVTVDGLAVAVNVICCPIVSVVIVPRILIACSVVGGTSGSSFPPLPPHDDIKNTILASRMLANRIECRNCFIILVSSVI